MTLKLKCILVLSTLLTASAAFGISPTPAFADPDTSATMLARTQATSAAERIEPIATLFSYSHKEQTATTLYVNSLPVLTFLDTGGTTSETAEAIAAKVSQTLNTLTAQTDFDAAQFSVSWQQGDDYALMYGADVIAMLNDNVFLADTTDNPAQDALIAINRFRRIMGGAEPLEAIANQPSNQNKANTGFDDAAAKVIRTYQGGASWYGPGFHGRRTASGEKFNQNALTAAHKTLPFGTKVRVTNVRNGRSVVVTINDRGPYAHGRLIDLSKGSAQQIGLVSAGTGTVKLEVLEN